MAADNKPQLGPAAAPDAQKSPQAEFHIGEELKDLEKDDKTRTFVIAGIVLVVIAIVVGIIAYVLRPQPKATGSIVDAYAVALPGGDSVLATVKLNFQNVGGKPLWIQDIKAQLTTADGKQYGDEAANAVDFDRYFQGFPELRDHSWQPLRVETKLAPGEQTRGSVIVSFPVTVDAFNSRKALAVTIEPYDQAPITIAK